MIIEITGVEHLDMSTDRPHYSIQIKTVKYGEKTLELHNFNMVDSNGVEIKVNDKPVNKANEELFNFFKENKLLPEWFIKANGNTETIKNILEPNKNTQGTPGLAHITVFFDFDLSKIAEIRKAQLEEAKKRNGKEISLTLDTNDFLLTTTSASMKNNSAQLIDTNDNPVVTFTDETGRQERLVFPASLGPRDACLNLKLDANSRTKVLAVGKVILDETRAEKGDKPTATNCFKGVCNRDGTVVDYHLTIADKPSLENAIVNLQAKQVQQAQQVQRTPSPAKSPTK